MVIQEHIDSDICIFDSFVFSDKYKNLHSNDK